MTSPHHDVAATTTRPVQANVDGAGPIVVLMPRWFYKACRDCKVPRSGDVPISRQGYCPRCGMARALDAVRSMHERVGEHNDRYRAALAEGRVGRPRNGVGGTPAALDLDDNNATP